MEAQTIGVYFQASWSLFERENDGPSLPKNPGGAQRASTILVCSSGYSGALGMKILRSIDCTKNAPWKKWEKSLLGPNKWKLSGGCSPDSVAIMERTCQLEGCVTSISGELAVERGLLSALRAPRLHCSSSMCLPWLSSSHSLAKCTQY